MAFTFIGSLLPRECKLSKMQDDVNMQMTSILLNNIALAAAVLANPACRDFVRQLASRQSLREII